MARQTGAEAIRAAVQPVINGAGLFLEDVQELVTGGSRVVRITIDLPEEAAGSLDLDTLADASRAIGKALDRADCVAGAYTLEVTTPGTARPLTEPRHFRRARGRLVRLTLTDGSAVTGRVRLVDDAVHLVDDAGTRAVPLADIAKGRIEVELSPIMEEGTVDDGDRTSNGTREA